MTRAIMIQGIGSDVGKSLIVAGLARAFAQAGLKVRPFKPQNMSNNSAVTADGGEIGRAQALQARAAGVAPSVHMNPVLLKPESDTGAQVIVQGRRAGGLKASDRMGKRPDLMPVVLDSFARIAAGADLVIVEGAGSPAEVNLRAGDIANMGFARAAGVPVALLGDIDRGGVIAQLVGTHAVLAPGDLRMIRGVAVNKFRGDPRLFDAGMDEIARRTGWAPLGLIPWFRDAWKLPAKDAVDHTRRQTGAVKIAVPLLSRIANFDDLDPLRLEPGVTVEIVPPGRPLPGDAALVLIPGTKATLADLAFFRAQGWDVDLIGHRRRGGHVLGLCGGDQMLGRTVADPEGIEGAPGAAPGLGLLDVTTVMTAEKRLAARRGYESHIGRTEGPGRARGWIVLDDGPEGAASVDGRVRGSDLHGIFAADGFRRDELRRIGASAGDRITRRRWTARLTPLPITSSSTSTLRGCSGWRPL
jgi:adenosylcobyric acid synthase